MQDTIGESTGLLDTLKRLLAAHPLGKEFLAAGAKERLEARKKLASERARLLGDTGAIEAARVEEGKAKAALAKAEAAARAALNAAQEAEGVLRGANWARESALARIESTLRSTASEQIDDFVAWVQGLFHELAAAAPTIGVDTREGYSLVDGRWRLPVWSSLASHQTRMATLAQMRVDAEALRLEALDEETLTKKLDAIRRRLDAADERAA